MAGNSPEEIKKVKRAFLVVGGILMVCTVLTVSVAVVPALDFGIHGFSTADALLGLAIAIFKASCVALIFMHLKFGKWEKPAIIWTFFGSIFFAFVMISLILLAELNVITFKGAVPYGSDMPAHQASEAYDLDDKTEN
jgi:hypothetical protein